MLFGHSPELPLVYASTSGNVEKVMEHISEVLSTHHFRNRLYRVEQAPLSLLEKNTVVVFGTSTWEHGELNPFFRTWYEAMAAQRLDGKQAAFVGLGDRRYEPVLFCEGMEKVRRRWLEQGGQEVLEPLRIQGEPYGVLSTLVEPWAIKLSGVINL